MSKEQNVIMPNLHIPSFAALTGERLRVKVVNIGANPVGGDPPYVVPLREGNIDVVGFEPNRTALAELQATQGPHELYLPHAIADGGTHTLRICAASGMTSLLQPNPAVLNLLHGFPEWSQVVATEPVQTVRLDDVPETEGADYLHLDIQGAELLALQHAEARLREAVVVQAEVEFLPMYVGQPLFSEIELFMRGRGYMFHRFYTQISRVVRPMMVSNDVYAGMGQAIWADAVFVRDLTRPEALSDRQLLAMASILHDCYGSLDLVLHLLDAHDRRRGDSRGAEYLRRLQGAPAAMQAA